MTRTTFLWLAGAGLILVALVAAVPFGGGPSSGQETCATYFSGDLGTAIPADNTTLVSTISVPESFTLTDVNVGPFNITHTFAADLDVHLSSPDNVRVELFTDVGGGGADFVDTVLDDASVNSIGTASAPFTGTFSPEGSLSAFNGGGSAGNWGLEILDDSAAAEFGTLDDWTLELCQTVEPSPSPTEPSPSSSDEPSPSPTEEPTPTETPAPTPTDTLSPTPTSTDTPSPTPSPAATPSPDPPPVNDNFADATVVTEPLPFTDNLSVAGATLEDLETPSSCGDVLNTVWYSFTPAQDGDVRITTSGSTYDTVIGVYTGDTVDALTEVDCNDDTAAALTSGIVLQATSGTLYQFQIGSLEPNPTQLNVRFESGAAPDNDNFVDAIAASPLPYTDTRGTFGATEEAGEPLDCLGSVIGGTVWYEFAAPADGTVTVTTLGSDYDTMLAVYGGTDFASLTQIACNDDSDTALDLTSEVQFSAINGTMYWIQAGGLGGDTGTLTLGVTQEAATETPTATPTEGPSPTPTATPSPTATPEPSPTDTPEPTPTDTPTSTPEPSPTDTPEPTPTATPTPTPGPSPDAAGTLVPNADGSNAGDWKDQVSNTCGVGACYEALDEDIDSPNDADFIVSVPDPVDRKIDFELQDAPADLATVTGINVRFRAFKQGSKEVSALVEVLSLPEIPLGPAIPQTLSESATTYSYSISGISLGAEDVNGLFLRVTAATAPGAGMLTTVMVTTINVDIDYLSTSTPTASPEPTFTPTPTATPEPSPTDAPTTATPTETATATPTPTPALGYYHPVVPSRILDTRSGPQGVPAGKVGPDAEITVDVTGVGDVPATDVSAVVINTTVTEPTTSSYLTVYPSGESRPPTSNLNFGAGQTVPNLVTVKVGADGNVAVYNAAGQVHIVLDVVGWYGEETGGSRFNGVNPKRILSTRDGIGAPSAKIGANASLVVDVTAVYGAGVPGSGVTAVVVNTTVTEATDASYLTVYPSDAGLPLASNLNFAAGQTVANLVTVKVGADGNVLVYNAAGQTHVIFDIVGWYGGSGDLFHPLTPGRILDTRSAPQGTPAGSVGADAEISVDVTGVGDVPVSGASNVIVNATVAEGTAQSFVTVYSSDVTTPVASNLNFGAGQTVANLVTAKIGADGNVIVYNAGGQTHVIFDVVGYFGP